jgi:hypothetical protein
MAASGWHPAHFTQKTCSFQVKTGLLHPLILKQMRQPLLFLCPGPVYVSLGLAADTEPAGYLSYRQDAAIIS